MLITKKDPSKTAALRQRAYAVLEIKSVDDDLRILEGIATTPSPDRMNDVVESEGAEFKLPLPFLWQHDSSQPIGNVVAAKTSKNGITVRVQLAKTDVPGTLKDRLDEAWQSIKLGLVRGLSIGFKPEEYSYMEDTGGFRFLRWAWLELSAVTIPANAEASIQAIKSLDQAVRPTSGIARRPLINKTAVAVASNEGKTKVKIAEHLKALQNARAEKVALLKALQEKIATENRGKTAAEIEEFDTLSNEITDLDRELKDTRTLQSLDVAGAANVVAEGGENGGVVVTDKRGQGTGPTHVRTTHLAPQLEKGILFARYVKCLGAAKGDMSAALAIANERYKDTPMIANVIKATILGGSIESALQKAAVNGGTTTDSAWAGPLVEYNQFAGDFVEFLRPQTILGKFGVGGVPSLRRVPFNIHIREQTSGGNAYWVGQGKPKPLTSFAFADVYLGWAKAATIAVLTEELLRFSNPSAEALVRDSLAAAIIGLLDTDFIDPAIAAVSNVSPASITHGAANVASTGNTAAAVRQDLSNLMALFLAANISPTTAVWIMPALTAMQVGLLRNSFGQKEFPDVNMNGGSLEGIPVITSQYVPHDSDGADVVIANASDIWLADDGAVTIDASREASLQMLDNPTNASDNATATTMVSMFQTNSVALRAERFINWQRRRPQAVAYLTGVQWGQP